MGCASTWNAVYGRLFKGPGDRNILDHKQLPVERGLVVDGKTGFIGEMS